MWACYPSSQYFALGLQPGASELGGYGRYFNITDFNLRYSFDIKDDVIKYKFYNCDKGLCLRNLESSIYEGIRHFARQILYYLQLCKPYDLRNNSERWTVFKFSKLSWRFALELRFL